MALEAGEKMADALFHSREGLLLFTLRIPKALIYLSLIFGFFLLIVEGIARIGGICVLGILMIVFSLFLALMPGGVLRKEQVLESWSILIEGGCGKAESIFENTRSFFGKE
ncbi:MAG: hypothetical protein DRO65_00195 [Candidatus Altiarchaeales archaeon]|nr:MAG: hypothetical protein DRO65_00195 [Candidatus Altiarchaeales archaeon]